MQKEKKGKNPQFGDGSWTYWQARKFWRDELLAKKGRVTRQRWGFGFCVADVTGAIWALAVWQSRHIERIIFCRLGWFIAQASL